jgi:hypothetical protein
MTFGDRLTEIWRQALVEDRSVVEIDGVSRPVGRTRAQGLRTVAISYQDWVVEGIEQNPETKSNWARLAREGQRIMQFRCRGRYVANVCEGTLHRYPAWTTLGLPE